MITHDYKFRVSYPDTDKMGTTSCQLRKILRSRPLGIVSKHWYSISISGRSGSYVSGYSYELYNEQDELINEAETELAFVGLNDWKPCTAPDFVMEAIEKNQKKATVHAN